MSFALPLLVLLSMIAAPATADSETALDRCLAEQRIPRAVRFVDPAGRVRFGRVDAAESGVPTGIVPLLPGDADLARVMDRVARADPAEGETAVRIAIAEHSARICSPLPLSQAAIEAEERVVVAAGLNYAAHAEESGGGDVFLFPKPVAPSRPYGTVVRHADVTLLDYEVELGVVVLADVMLDALPSRDEFLASSAFFVANEVTDREPIVLDATVTGPGTGFVSGKGRVGFFPAGPWIVRGTELFAALDACGAVGLGLRLEVDEGDGFALRQDSTTERMIRDPLALLAMLASEVRENGIATHMPAMRDGRTRFYPLAVDATAPRLPAGSVILTGTPEGVAMQAPSPLPVVFRGMLRLRGPFVQFAEEERARALSGAPGGYLAPGDRVRAGIDGLGTQVVEIVDSDAEPRPSACRSD